MQKLESKKSLNTKVKIVKKALVEGSDSESVKDHRPRAVADDGVEYQSVVAAKK
jgi:hypothetical protein